MFWVTLYPIRVKTVARFNADDPWNQNHSAAFTVDAYLMARKGAPVPQARPIGVYRYGLRGGIVDAEYMMPDSLSSMWRTNRIPLEALPRLLEKMRPTLGNSDYRPMLENAKGYTIMCWFFGCLFTPIALSPIAISIFTGEFSLSFAGMFALSMGVVSLVPIYITYFRGKWRRTRQISWILSQGALGAG